MRRIITALTAVLIAVLPMMTPHITANCARAVGDADGDGDITPADASFVLSYYAELATGIDEYWDDADMNCGDIDVTKLLRRVTLRRYCNTIPISQRSRTARR